MTYLVLVPFSIAMGLVGLGAFFWALRHDQFDDPDGAAERILSPDPAPARPRQPKGPGHTSARTVSRTDRHP